VNSLKERTGIFRHLLSGGAEVNAKDKEGNTALHRACYWGRLEVILLLKSRKETRNEKNKEGHTPLQMAYSSRSTRVVEVIHWLLKIQAVFPFLRTGKPPLILDEGAFPQ
jgi:ankyrin repeat protein